LKTLTKAMRAKLRHLCLTDLYFLSKSILGFNRLQPVPHRELAQFCTNPSKRKLLIGSRAIYKTTVATISRAIFEGLKNPNIRILIVQNTQTNATKSLVAIRNLLDSTPLLRLLFPEVIPENPKAEGLRWNEEGVCLRRSRQWPEATFEAAGIGTNLTSRHYDLILADDIVTATRDDMSGEEMEPSPDDIDKAIGWHRISHGLLIDQDESEIQHAANRWCQHDFVRHIMDNEVEYDTLTLAADDGDGISKYPRILSNNALVRLKRSLGTLIYSTQICCQTMDASRLEFKDEWIRLFDSGAEPKWESMNIYGSIDLAKSKQRSAAHTAYIIVGVDARGDWWILDALRSRDDTTEKIDTMFKMAKHYGTKTFAVETVLFQEMLVDALKKEMGLRDYFFSITPVVPRQGEAKDMRIRSLSPRFEAGAVHIRRDLRDLITELKEYPYGRYVDLLDALAYVLRLNPRGLRPAVEPSYVSPWSLEGIMKRLPGYGKKSAAFDRQATSA